MLGRGGGVCWTGGTGKKYFISSSSYYLYTGLEPKIDHVLEG